MNFKAIQYASPLLVYVLAIIAFTQHGIACWFTLLYAWVLIPVAELLIKPNPVNMEEAEEKLAAKNKLYDYMLYLVVPAQYAALVIFLFSMQDSSLNIADIYARVFTMGILCGSFGINVGHELGHRVNKTEQLLAKSLLLTSLYMHFFIEHNKGHHKRVATPEDPSSARLHEPVYFFYFRTVVFSYFSAWKIANTDVEKKGGKILSWQNEMVQVHLIELAFVGLILFAFGWLVTLYYLQAAAVGILLLETVNYIEHYGLSRKATGDGRYERAMPGHSWNSDHIIGRLMLFELTRHSDHHYLASRKYQVLRHHAEAPQLPTGYPGMMILALVPPAWFYVMHRKMRKHKLV